jgi:CheY-like chemotaxis protein
MPKRVLDVGNCGVDHAAICALVKRHFDCDVIQADGPEDVFRELQQGQIDLVLVNRKLDRDYSDGIELIKQIKANPATTSVPVMLVTNYPEHQDAAITVGALRGFGKLEFEAPATKERLAAVLGE